MNAATNQDGHPKLPPKFDQFRGGAAQPAGMTGGLNVHAKDTVTVILKGVPHELRHVPPEVLARRRCWRDGVLFVLGVGSVTFAAWWLARHWVPQF